MGKKQKTNVKHKRGIKLETRIITAGILIILQLLVLFAVFYKLVDYSATLYFLQEIAGVIMVIYLVNRRGMQSYNTAWIIFILLFPIFGISVFLLYGGGRVMPHLKRKMSACEKRYKRIFSDDRAIHEELHIVDNSKASQPDYLTRESGFPLYDGSTVEYLSPGEVFLPRFIEELINAEKYIFIEFFIIAEGKMWNEVYKVLREKAALGVDVRVMFDDFGSIKRQRRGFIERLKKDGIKVAVFNRIGPRFNLFVNNRNHRKIVVIDGKTAVTGGLNLADEYINKLKRFGYWLDCAAIVKGRAVTSFLSMFCSTWEFTTGEKINIGNIVNDEPVEGATGYVLPYCDGPLDSHNPAEGIYMRLISGAQRYVYITSPYLIIDDTMKEILIMAAKSGIDIRIITPHHPDKWYVHPVTQYNYLELIESGVRIYEYTPGFIHSKLMVSDDSVATVGTVNMDYRSFVLHFECGVWMYKTEAVNDIRDHIRSLLPDCEEITLDSWRKKSRMQRFKCWILHIFAPFM